MRARGVVWAALAMGLGCAGSAPQGTEEDGGGGGDGGTVDADVWVEIDAAGDPGPEVFRAFSADSPWNQAIPEGAALHPQSAALVDHLRTSSPYGEGFGINIQPWGVPVYWADAATPLAMVSTDMPGTEGFGASPTAVPIPAGAAPDPEADGHMCVVDRVNGRVWDFYQARDQGGGTWGCTLCAASELGGTGVRPPKNGAQAWQLSHGSRACGFPLIAGLITVEELEAGRIEHALVLAYPGIRSRYYTPPASTAQATFGAISPDWGVPCGGRVRLDPSVDVEALGLSPSGLAIARALQVYGAYVGDYSGSISLYADGSPAARAAWDAGLLDTYEVFDEIDLADLRVLAWPEPLYDDGN